MLVFLLLCSVLIAGSAVSGADVVESVRAYTRSQEFDYVSWTLEALGSKLAYAALQPEKLLGQQKTLEIVNAYIAQVQKVQQLDAALEVIYADPNTKDPQSAGEPLKAELMQEQAHLATLAPIAEEILQAQLSQILTELGFGMGGQVIPPVLYQVTQLPLSLVVSPRTEIKRLADISLEAGLNTPEKETLERQVFDELDFSALVVPVGGIGAYPTMVMQTADLVWLTEVIAHEWTHNYLTLRPLGMNYNTSPDLRTINETTASLVGKELSLIWLERFYPALLPEPTQKTPEPSAPVLDEDQPGFDFRAEMRETRVTVEAMLANGEVEEAEAYMEMRRQIFWENGYPIRKLNQAYFAFHGAYNDEPGGGAAGADPIGPAVTALRAQKPDLRSFLREISWVTSFEGLQALITR